MNLATSRSLFLIPFFFGCGLSDQINSQINQQEANIETEAFKQVLNHTNLLVGGVMAQAAVVGTAAVCQPVPNSQCTVCYLDTPTQQSLNLSKPDCAITPPPEGKQFGLTLDLKKLSLSAVHKTGTLLALSGEGILQIGAQLPVIGDYHGTVTYDIHNDSIIDTSSGHFNLDTLLTYQSDSSLLEFNIKAQGASSTLSGTITATMGSKLSCKVAGSLSAPVINCQ